MVDWKVIFYVLGLCEPLSKARRSLNFLSQPQTPDEADKENRSANLTNEACSASNSISNTLETDSLLAATLNVQTAQNTKKRTINELFGDIDDILNENIAYSLSKKPKGDVSDLELIEHILELRKLAKQRENPATVYRTNCSMSAKDRDKRNLSYRVPKYSFISVKRSDNERVYVRFHSETYEKEQAALMMKNSGLSGVMGDRFKEVWEEATKIVSFFTVMFVL